jgi:tartrate/fumarate subfamily iron-sulfur-dependent hydro-lyase beta chain
MDTDESIDGMVKEMKKLSVPLSYEDIAQLRAGDLVSLSGNIWTSRSGFYRKYIEEGQAFPFDSTQNNVMLHSGPIMKAEADGTYKVKAISITTSVRFDKWEPEVIESLQLRAIIAKGRVGRNTREAMKKLGCVHLSRTGTFAGAFALKVKKVVDGFWLDLGLPEALWVFEFDEFGPLVVETDILGRSIYDQIADDFNAKLPTYYRQLGIEGFEYAEK